MMKWHNKFKEMLRETGSRLTANLGVLFKQAPDDDFLEELERRLLMTDVGVAASRSIVANVKKRATHEKIRSMAQLTAAVEEEIAAILRPCECTSELDMQFGNSPSVVLMVGVNGNGKTTTAAKFAYHYKQQGKSAMLVAADTFRAAAVEQLQVWAQRCDVAVTAARQGSDSAAVVYTAMAEAKSQNIDIVVVDTAGRLHTNKNLMDELKKIKRVIAKQNAAAPIETILIIDGTTGQNAKKQVAEFHKSLGVDSLIITKLDGSTKGGILVAVACETKMPVRFIGAGETLDDLYAFNAKEYAAAMMQT